MKRLTVKLLVFLIVFTPAHLTFATGDNGNSHTVDVIPQSTQIANNLGTNDQFTGAFTYGYSFALPPGRNNLTPDLKLVYNSAELSNESYVGYGWSFNIPSITRLNKHGTENLYDHFDFTSSLWGDLVKVSTTTYQAEVESGPFTSFTFSSNAWTVYDSEGTRYLFGSSAAARQDNASSSDEVYKWMLEEIRDTNDNYIKYEYTKDAGQIYPSVITYTGHGSTDGDFEVIFNSTSTSMSSTLYYPDFPVITNYKIYNIEVQEDDQWVRRYDIAYTTGANGYRKLLDSITETGRDLVSNTTATKPITDFSYQAGSYGFATSTGDDWELPIQFYDGETDDPTLIRIHDINGDSYPDVIHSTENGGESNCSYDVKTVYINDTHGGWDTFACASQTWTPPLFIKDDNGGFLDHGTRIFDYNGDFLDDFVWAYLSATSSQASSTSWDVFRNQGTPSSTFATTSVSVPIGFVFHPTYYSDNAVQPVDVNGDGLIDLTYGWIDELSGLSEETFVGTGSGWNIASSTHWILPHGFLEEENETFTFAQFLDLNGDNLNDFLFKHENSEIGSIVGINNGHSWIKYDDGTWESPLDTEGGEDLAFGNSDMGFRSWDINGDRVADIIRANWNGSSIGYEGYLGNLNVSDPFAVAITFATSTGFPVYFAISNDHIANPYVQVADINADGVSDLLYAELNSSEQLITNTYLSTATPFVDMLTGIQNSAGATTTVEYELSTQYFDGGDNLLNPSLPMAITTVKSVGTNDGLGNFYTDQYSYASGSYYYNTPFDRKFAGFGLVTKTDDDGNVTKTYFHQGNSSASSTGEYQDHISKRGKTYRVEQYDDSNNLYAKTINKWDRFDRGNRASFVELIDSVTFTYDGDSDHKDKASRFTYSTSTGHATQIIEWGEVTGSNDGTFSDTGSDKFTTTFSFATSTGTSTPTFYKVSQETKVNQSSAQVSDRKIYYDTLSLGSLNKGNPTKEELWVASSTYIDTEKTYNSYGLVIQEKDPRDKTTTYSYDSFNIYPASSSDPVGNVRLYQYDYSAGKISQLTDPNGRVFQTLYDPFDRVREEKQPDLASPSTTTTKVVYQYTDSNNPDKLQITRYLTSTTTADTYVYTDGFGRKVQERIETESSDWATRDYTYNQDNLVTSESFPYLSAGASFTGTSSPPISSLLTSYAYDPLGKVTQIANNIGTSTYTHDDWIVSVTDSNGKVKDFTNDAYGNLVQVVEHYGTTTYTTTYEYNGNRKLTKITDADANIRNFTYDGIGRRLTAQDLHDAGDGTFGTWTYAYDDAGNIATTTDPKSQVIVRTYDNLNRVLTEDYTGSGGTEISYAYDTCTEGEGRLCTATSTSAVSTFTYNALGLVASETKNVSSTSYTTTYTYDRQGNITSIVYPDSSEVAYTYNTAGQLETIKQKESGGSFEDVVLDFDYGPTGQVVYKSLANNVDSTYTYDENQLYRLTSILTEFVGGIGGGNLDPAYWDGVRLAFLDNEDIGYDIGDLGELHAESSSIEPEPVPIPGPGAQEATPSEEIEPAEVIEDTQTNGALPEILESSNENPEEADFKPQTEVNPDPQTLNEKRFLLTTAPGTRAEKGVANMTTEFIEELANGAKVYEAKIFGTDIKYRNSEGNLVAIDPTLEKGEEAWIMNRAPFGARLARESGDKVITFRLKDLELYLDPISGQKSEGNLLTRNETETVVYSDAIGPDIDLQVTLGTNLLKKEAVLESKDALRSLIEVAGYVEIPFLLRANEPLTLISKEGELSEMNTFSTNEGVELRSETAIAYLWDPVAVDANGSVIPIEIRYEKTGEDIILTKQLPLSWLEEAEYPVRTDTTVSYTGGTGDGYIYKTSANWNTSHDATSGTSNNTETASETQTNGSSITRTAFPFDTSGLPDNAIITAADVNIYAYTKTNNDNDGDDFIRVVQTTTGSDTSLSGSDYDDIGAVDNPTAGASDTDFGSISTNSYNSFELNSTGLGWISKTGYTKLGLREGHDALDHESLGNNIIGWRTANHATLKPSLDVTYIIDEAPSAPTGLLTENRTNPSDITDTTPEFSAIYQDADSGDIATHYQIQVSTSSAMSNTRWDSTKTALVATTTAGNRINDISYAGSALSTSTTYYWRIKLWDDDNIEGTWSATNTFALVDPIVIDADTIQYLQYTYDDVGNITQIDEDAGTGLGRTVVYSYDDLHRLMSASTTVASTTPFKQTYSYSPIGNITGLAIAGVTSTYSYAETGSTNPQAATTIGGASLAYDTNGNLVSYDSSTYTWDFLNRLTTVSTGSATTTYAYDHTTNRVKKTVGATSTIYANDMYNTDGTTKTKHVYAGQDLIATIETKGATSTTQYLHLDHLRGINAVTDENGDAIQATDYYPYGATRVDQATSTFEEQRKFTGHEYDEEADLTYANARYYEQNVGRWVSQDPASRDNPSQFLSDPQQFNYYTYGRNNPLILVDRDGRKVEVVGRQVLGVGSHLFYRITPDHPDEINISGLPAGAKSFTLGGYNQNPGNPFNNKLVGGIGYDGMDQTNPAYSDFSLTEGSSGYQGKMTVQPAEGDTDSQLINKLGSGLSGYQNNLNYYFMGSNRSNNGNSNNLYYHMGKLAGISSQLDQFKLINAPGSRTDIPAGVRRELQRTLKDISKALRSSTGSRKVNN